MTYLACLIAVFLGYGIACLFGDEQRAYCLGYREGYDEGRVHGRLEGRLVLVRAIVPPLPPPVLAPVQPEFDIDSVQAPSQSAQELDYHA